MFRLKKIKENDFCFELLVEPERVEDTFRVVFFVYASTESKEIKVQ